MFKIISNKKNIKELSSISLILKIKMHDYIMLKFYIVIIIKGIAVIVFIFRNLIVKSIK